MNTTDQLILQFDTVSEKDKLTIFSQLADVFDPITEARRYEVLGVQFATRTSNIVPFCLGILLTVTRRQSFACLRRLSVRARADEIVDDTKDKTFSAK